MVCALGIGSLISFISITRPVPVAVLLSCDLKPVVVLDLVRERANALYVVLPSTQLPRAVAGSTAALMFRVYQRFGPGVKTAEAEERRVGATGVPPAAAVHAATGL